MRPGIDAGECYVREVAAYLLVRVLLAPRSWVCGWYKMTRRRLRSLNYASTSYDSRALMVMLAWG